jgi:hypothetical protein
MNFVLRKGMAGVLLVVMALTSAVSGADATRTPSTPPAPHTASTPVAPLAPVAPAVVSANNPPGANPFETEVTALEAKLAQAPITFGPIVFYGSSSIRLWKSLQQDFPGMLLLIAVLADRD